MRTCEPRKGAARPALLGCAVLMGAAGLCGCVDFQRATQSFAPATVNVESPAASAVLAAEAAPLPAPSFRSVPPKVETASLPTAFQWKRSIDQLNRAGGDVAAWAAENPVLAPTTTESFDASALAALKYNPGDVPPPDQAARSDAYAQGARAAAAAPPPPH